MSEQQTGAAGIDTSSDARFTRYYEAASQSPATLQRFASVKHKVERLLRRHGWQGAPRAVLDIGCGAGTQALLWARDGHAVAGLDINAPLVDIARERCAAEGRAVRLEVGTATALPFDGASFDVVLMPELLEHVADWQGCLAEALRVLRPGGILYLSTTNSLCPKQQEFELPFYSWYPAALKRRCVRLALTTHPQWVNHARYPAVNWFTPYGLSRYLAARGVRGYDRFDMLDTGGHPAPLRWALALLRALPPLRLLGHLATPGTTLFGVRER